MCAQVCGIFAWQCCIAARVNAVYFVQVPAARQQFIQPRTLNTAASVPSSTAANLAAIDPPVQTSQQDSPQAAVDFRAQWAHALRNALRSTDNVKSLMDSMGKYLRASKAEVDAGGKSSVMLDHQIISNYVDCEDVLIAYEPQYLRTNSLMHACVPELCSRETV